jgi:hypothetical protein
LQSQETETKMDLKSIDGSRFLFDPTSKNLVNILAEKIPEFNNYEGKIPSVKVFQYIILMYDPQSPLWRDVMDYYVRKGVCADMVGFPKTKGQWSKEAEAILIGQDSQVNDMIVAFIAQLGLVEMYQLIAYLSLLSSETRKAIDFRGDKNSIDIITKTGDKIRELLKVVFKSGEYDEITQVRKALYSRLEKERLRIRPEEVVRMISEEGGLPDEFNPYGDNYKPEKPKFLGDEEPKE